MSPTENDILQTLIALDQAVKSMPTADPKPDLLPMFQRLDQLANELPPGTDPQLLHYLERKSYEKARARLEGQATERGSCGR